MCICIQSQVGRTIQEQLHRIESLNRRSAGFGYTESRLLISCTRFSNTIYDNTQHNGQTVPSTVHKRDVARYTNSMEHNTPRLLALTQVHYLPNCLVFFLVFARFFSRSCLVFSYHFFNLHRYQRGKRRK